MPRTRYFARRLRFTMGNNYSEWASDLRLHAQRSFKVHCKTTEFESRLNLPRIALEMLGREEKIIQVEAGYSGLVFNCIYRYHKVKVRCDGWSRLSHSWTRLMDAMNIQQGDTLYFERDVNDNLKFHVSLDKQEGAVKIEEEKWI